MSKSSLSSKNEHVESYVESTKVKALDLVIKVFPQKIIDLNKILSSEGFTLKDPTSIHQELNIPVPDAQAITKGMNNSHESPQTGKKRKLDYKDEDETETNNLVQGTKVLVLPSGPITCNKKISNMIDVVKPYIRYLVEDTNLLKMWVTFLIPKIEDGNNFGVSIQEECLGEIRTVEAEGAAFYEQISRYYITRGKIITKVAKYPMIDDYRKLVSELDEKEYLSLKIVLCEIRNHYIGLYDLILKNMEKIVRPRSQNSENLY